MSAAYMGEVRMEIDYKHCRCVCGGIIGQYSKAKGLTCERCNKELELTWILMRKRVVIK